MDEPAHVWLDGETTDLRAARLATAYEELADVLETLDLEDEPELAEVVVDAVEATDRAYLLEAWGDERAALD